MPEELTKVELTPTQQLMLLRDLTAKTGILHEAQVQQIKLWPFAICPNVGKSEAHVSVEKQTIEYHLTPEKGQIKLNPKIMEKFMEGVSLLLGPEWRIQIFGNGSLIFPINGSNRKPKQRGKKGSRRVPRKLSKGRNK